MAKLVVQGAELKCQQGSSPSSLNVMTTNGKTISGKKIATIMDFTPMTCISGFGQCHSPLNPMVVAAEAAGSPPPPCIPQIIAPWSPGSSKTSIDEIPVLLESDKTSCAYCPMGISISSAQQTKANSK